MSVAFLYFVLVITLVIGRMLPCERCLFYSCVLLMLNNLMCGGFVFLLLSKLLGDVTLKPGQISRHTREGFFTDEVRVL